MSACLPEFMCFQYKGENKWPWPQGQRCRPTTGEKVEHHLGLIILKECRLLSERIEFGRIVATGYIFKQMF